MGDPPSCPGICCQLCYLTPGGGGPDPFQSSPRARWLSKRQCMGIALLLLALSSFLYVILYNQAVISSQPSDLLHRMQILQSPDEEVPLYSTNWTQEVYRQWNSFAVNSTKERPSSGAANRTNLPLLTLFSSWVDRPDMEQVRNLTMQNWASLAPAIVPVLFTNSSKLAGHARAHGWYVLPISRAAVGVPILKNMYLDVIPRFNSSLYAYANGDILFTPSLVETLMVILASPLLPLSSHPVLVVGQRTNVPNVQPHEAATFEGVARIARARGKLFTTMAEDFFITDGKYPWADIPGVVIGRAAYDNWLVLNSIRSKHVVVDATATLLAVHQTTKAGNYEGFTHANSSYNRNLLTRMYKRVQYMAGCVDCAPWRTRREPGGNISVVAVAKRPKHC